jgi:hypothetical protein
MHARAVWPVLGQIGLSGRLGCALERPVEVSLHPGCVDAYGIEAVGDHRARGAEYR